MEGIRRAWRAQVVRLHPDRAPGAGERLRAVNTAYAVLKDPHKRAAYDAALAAASGKNLAAQRRGSSAAPARRQQSRGILNLLREILWPFTNPAEVHHGR